MKQPMPLLPHVCLPSIAAATIAWLHPHPGTLQLAGGWTGKPAPGTGQSQGVAKESPTMKQASMSLPAGATAAAERKSPGHRLLPWLGVAVLYAGTSMLAAGFLAQRALQRAFAMADVPAVDAAAGTLAGIQAPVTVWWVPETFMGFMLALAMMMLGFGLLVADSDRARSTTYGN